ncbi:MAG: ATP-binding protein [Variibacter sp.]
MGGGLYACPRRCGFGALSILVVCGYATSASAQDSGTLSVIGDYIAAFGSLERHEIAALALTLGIIAFAVLTAIMLVRLRREAARLEVTARTEITNLKADLDRATTLLLSEPQVIVTWPADDGEPDILGDTAGVTAAPAARRALSFGAWLSADSARALDHAVEQLRARGEAFAMNLSTPAGRHIEAEGRPIGGRAVLRLKESTGTQRALAELQGAHRQLLSDVEILRALIERLPSPFWVRRPDGQLAWVNDAYARAVEASDKADAVHRQIDLLEQPARLEQARMRAQGEPYLARIPVIVAGARHLLDVLDVPSQNGSAGIGIDATEAETMRTELGRMIEAHRRTLDQLHSAVASFGADHRLTFYNAAYRSLWGLDAGFLDQQPADSAVLDRLRAMRKLPEQADFRAWRTQLYEAYRAIEPKEHWWHLPDGRTLRVVTTPNPEGGVTYVFDDLTERFDLERRHDALLRVQGETLDNLAEGVAVFGSDGRMRLSNPAFMKMWKVSPALLGDRPHIEAVIERCKGLYDAADFWQALRGAITGFERTGIISEHLERSDGSVVNCATVPLPDGATLVTFQDTTDTVNVERALRERNDALEMADELKNDFVHHVSYELRTPLTNIIGFAHLLHDPSTGPLTDKQADYLGYISSSSAALLAIINDILDLASIDAGAMKLDLGPVDIRHTIDAAAEGVQDRLAEKALRLDLRVAPNVGSFVADERRIRQVLFNLLSNAIAFSPASETITLRAERREGALVVSIADRGRGIPAEIVDRVFNRFETHALGSQHRGAGLGLSIVRSFVELHGGSVSLETAEGRGTTVTCVFPLEQTHRRVAAE